MEEPHYSLGLKEINLPDDLMQSLTDYLAYCAEDGNRKSTKGQKYRVCSKFLENISDLGCKQIQDMTGENVQTAFLSLGSMRYWERKRPYLRYLFENDFIKQDYSGLIHHCRFLMPQPTVYSVKEIRHMENSFDLSLPSGIKNYAMTLFMTRYGIRARDVAALSFDNVDFVNNRLHFIQQKTNEPCPGLKAPCKGSYQSVKPHFGTISTTWTVTQAADKGAGSPASSASQYIVARCIFTNRVQEDRT